MGNSKYLSSSDFQKCQGHTVLFGGSFDPPQKAHISMAKLVEEKFRPDRIVFIPARQNPLKTNRPQASAEERAEMLSIICNRSAQWWVSKIEIERDPTIPSYSIETVKLIRSMLPQPARLSLLMGSDSAAVLFQWKNSVELVSLVTSIYVVIRGHDELTWKANVLRDFGPDLAQRFVVLKGEELYASVSSTDARQHLASHKDVNSLLPEEIQAYVAKKNLYAV